MDQGQNEQEPVLEEAVRSETQTSREKTVKQFISAIRELTGASIRAPRDESRTIKHFLEDLKGLGDVVTGIQERLTNAKPAQEVDHLLGGRRWRYVFAWEEQGLTVTQMVGLPSSQPGEKPRELQLGRVTFVPGEGLWVMDWGVSIYESAVTRSGAEEIGVKREKTTVSLNYSLTTQITEGNARGRAGEGSVTEKDIKVVGGFSHQQGMPTIENTSRKTFHFVVYKHRGGNVTIEADPRGQPTVVTVSRYV